jgi:hypothetical protein
MSEEPSSARRPSAPAEGGRGEQEERRWEAEQRDKRSAERDEPEHAPRPSGTDQELAEGQQ